MSEILKWLVTKLKFILVTSQLHLSVSSMNYWSVRMNVLVMFVNFHRFSGFFLQFLALEELSRIPRILLILGMSQFM